MEQPAESFPFLEFISYWNTDELLTRNIQRSFRNFRRKPYCATEVALIFLCFRNLFYKNQASAKCFHNFAPFALKLLSSPFTAEKQLKLWKVSCFLIFQLFCLYRRGNCRRWGSEKWTFDISQACFVFVLLYQINFSRYSVSFIAKQ